MARILRLVATSATQNVTDNTNDDIFMPATGDYSAKNVFGAPFNPKPLTPKPLAPTPSTTVASKAAEPAKEGWFTRLFGTKDERSAKRTQRRANRAARKAARKLRKSIKQLKVEAAAKERALALGKSQAEAQAAATEAGLKVKAQEEAAIAAAEEAAKTAALKSGLTPQQAEDAANAAGGLLEDKIFGGGYGTETKDETKFWGSMSTGAKIGLIGGGVVVLGLITWGIVASRKK